MELKINNNIKLTPLIFQKQKITLTPASSQPQILNTTTLPGFESRLGKISFGNLEPQYKANDFLLPPNCKPDKYQIEAAVALQKGHNTIVTAPTGTGKTAIAHFIIKKNFKEGKRTFYTTPLKALSNQKYHDLKKLFGNKNVGILTGDRKENTKAPIVIMTTEIYRNMVASNYFEKRNNMLDNLQTVIFDEFHYMGDPDRGSVWEESIMFTPKQTQILALSATVGNNQKITNWINEKKDKTTSLIDVPISNRHVPLKFILKDISTKSTDAKRSNNNSRNPLVMLETIQSLAQTDKLPAIVFIFSKAFAEKLLNAAEIQGQDLTTKEEKHKIEEILKKYQKDQSFYSNGLNENALFKGYATHSAAILPLQKQLIEELFNKKLIKVVFATETLAAGINMPARTVILSDAQKPGTPPKDLFNKSFLRPLLPNEFHQMSGRAGRRGIDSVGYVVLLSDSASKQNLFKALMKSKPNSINSNFKFDASSVTGFYQKTEDPTQLTRILDKTFSLFELPATEKESKYKEHIKNFEDFTTLLEIYGFLKKTQYGYRTTQKGELISEIKGKPQIPIVQAILKKRFENLSPVDLAGILAAMTIPPGINEPDFNSPTNTIRLDESTLFKINSTINKILKNTFNFSSEQLNADNTNDEILDAIDKQYKKTIQKNIYSLYNEKKSLLLSIEENELERSLFGSSNELTKKIEDLYHKLKTTKNEINLLSQYRQLIELTQERLGLEAYKLSKKDQKTEDTYNKIHQGFEKYNSNAAKLMNPSIPIATLNPTAMIFVKKWAQLNAESKNYTKNWDIICEMLKETGSMRYEGDLFNTISQTIDFIHQFETAVKKTSILFTSQEDKLYCDKLIQNCQIALKLLKQPPLYPDEKN